MWQDGTSPALQSGQPSGRHCPFGATSVFQMIQVELRLQTPKRGPTGGADFAPTKEHKTEKGKFLFSFSWGELLRFVCFSSPSSIKRVWHRAYRLPPPAPPGWLQALSSGPQTPCTLNGQLEAINRMEEFFRQSTSTSKTPGLLLLLDLGPLRVLLSSWLREV